MPRAYKSEQRQAATDETRARIVAGARELLLSTDGFQHFTMDRIARQTNVARMTVYNQFESKSGIYEALADDIAARGKIRENMERAFKSDDAREGLVLVIRGLVHFWMSDADAMRKLHALSELDPESHAQERESRRRTALTTILARLAKQEKLGKDVVRRTFDALDMMLTFAAVDSLHRRGQGERAIAARVADVAEATLGIQLTG